MSQFNLKAIEKQAILKALEYHNGHRNKACESLGISIKCLRNKLIRWGMSDYLKFQYKMSTERKGYLQNRSKRTSNKKGAE